MGVGHLEVVTRDNETGSRTDQGLTRRSIGGGGGGGCGSGRSWDRNSFDQSSLTSRGRNIAVIIKWDSRCE